MSDDDTLRTRIAAALYRARGLDDFGNISPFLQRPWLQDADAVIAELQPELKSLERLAQWQAAPRLPIRGALFDPESWDSWEGHRR